MKLLLFTLFAATAALAQQLDPTVAVARIPAGIIRQLSPVLAPSADAVQVWLSVPDQRPALAEVVLKYEHDGQILTAVSTRRLVSGFDIHSFPVPVYTVRIVSITVAVAPIQTTKEFTDL